MDTWKQNISDFYNRSLRGEDITGTTIWTDWYYKRAQDKTSVQDYQETLDG